jgi:hypothetical protein
VQFAVYIYRKIFTVSGPKDPAGKLNSNYFN